MVQLYINNQQVIIDENIYFPFTKKVIDFENPTIINFEGSKTITIKRCVENDDVFGNIAEITRITYGFEDNKSNILFNQLRKVKYELYNDGEYISSGIIRILNITETEYEIELYDDIINIIESFEGIKLSDLDIYENDSSTIFSKSVNKTNILNSNSPVIPVFGEEDYEFSKNKIFANEYNNTLDAYNIKFIDLTNELTQMKARTFKSYSHSFALPINKVFESINKKYNNIIEVDNNVYNILGDLYIKLNKPNAINFSNDSVITGGTTGYYNLAASDYAYGNFKYTNTNDLNLEIKNQKIEIKSDLEFEFKTDNPSHNLANIMTTEYINEQFVNHYFSDAYGTNMGRLYIKSKLKFYNSTNQVLYESKENINSIVLLQNINTIGNSTTGNIVVKSSIVNTFTINTFVVENVDRIDLEFTLTNKYDETLPIDSRNNSVEPFNRLAPRFVDIRTNSYKHTILSKNNDKIMSGDIIKASNLYPNVNIKDFLINFIKGFNLDINNVNGKIKISEKKYIETDEPLIITDIKSIKTGFDFSELKFNTGLPKSDDLDNYKTKYNKTYGEQNVNTSYSIKMNKKDITLPFSIPFYKINNSYFAYDMYGQYFNGGYSREPIGVFPDNDILTFAYLKKNGLYNNGINVTDDYLEEFENENEVGMVHRNLFYNPNQSEEKQWIIKNEYLVNEWYTLSPYLFNNEGKIIKSLEVNKPLYSYANINDSQYNVDTTLYHNYFKNLINSIYDVNSHIISCKMLIDDKINLNKIYNYNNSNYIISEVLEYNPINPGLYDVKLMKVKDKQKLVNMYNKKNYIEITSHLPIVNNYNQPTYLNVSGKIYNLNNKTISNIKLVTSLTNSNPTIGGNNCVAVTGNIFGDNYTIWNYNLTTNSRYYFRTVLTYADNTTDVSPVKSVDFSGGVTPPSWTTLVEQINDETLRFNLTGMDAKGAEIDNVEVFGAYHTTPSETSYDIYQNSNENNKNYIFTFSGLNAVDSPIYYMIKVTNSTGLVNYVYGEKPITVFVDPAIGGVLTTNRTQTSLSGVFSFDLGTTDLVYELSVIIGTKNNTNKDVYLQKLPIVPDSGLKEFTFNGLLPSTTYYIIVYVKYNSNTGVEELYNNLHTTNTTYLPPSIACSAVSNSLLTNVDVNAYYQIDIPSRISRRGICYSQTVSVPTISDTIQYDTTQSNGSKLWTFSASIPSKSNYRIRCYIQTTDGYTYYSPVATISINNSPIILPVE